MPDLKVTIDTYAGFCFGVERAIRISEENIFGEIPLRSLGELVHNERENERLMNLGMKVVTPEDFINLKHGRVLFRAHGEKPGNYKVACRNGTRVIDATCPVVKKLQSRISKESKLLKKKGGVVIIFGKNDHPEVTGLVGNTEGNVMVLEGADDVKVADLPAVTRMFAQTTRGTEEYLIMQDAVRRRLNELHPPDKIDFKSYNTICGQVSGRERNIQKFAAQHDLILFVGGRESSNGKLLYGLGKRVNSNSHYISGIEDIQREWFNGVTSVGITGATSTPGWLMEEVQKEVQKY